jgi:hypothetical protein
MDTNTIEPGLSSYGSDFGAASDVSETTRLA